MYSAVTAHATPLLACALNYVSRKSPEAGYVSGVSLRNVPVRHIIVFGPKTRKDAIQRLFGSGGYIYAFRSSAFRGGIPGLGPSEVVSDVPVTPVLKVRLSLADVLSLAKFMGVRIEFEKQSLE